MNLFKRILCFVLVFCLVFPLCACSIENMLDNAGSPEQEQTGDFQESQVPSKSEIEDYTVEFLSYDPDDYIGDLETFVYGLLINELEYIYDVFPACVQLSDSYFVYGLAYTDYTECYTNEDESEAYFMSGFLPFVGELDIPEEDFESGLYIYDLEYEDESTKFVWKYKSDAFMEHCVVYGAYLQYGVDSNGYITYNAIPYEREKCDISLGALYSYDDTRYLYDTDFGNYTPITGISLAVDIDYDGLEREINAILEEQNANFLTYDIETVAYTSQDAVVSFLLSMQEETFLGYSVDYLIEASQSLNPLECFRITADGLTVIDIAEIPPEEPTALCKWLVGTACVIVAAVGMAVTIIAPLLPPPWPHIAGALGGAASGAAVDVFMQVVVDNRTLGDVNWTRVCVSAVSGAISGLINPYMMKVGGAGGFFLDTGVDALIGGVESAAITWIEGGDSTEILHAFGAGFAIGAAASAGLKGIVAGASTGIKKIAKTAKEIAEKLPPSVNRVAAKMVAPVKNIGQAIGDGMEKLTQKVDDVLFRFKHISVKNASDQVEKALKETIENISDNNAVLGAKKLFSDLGFDWDKIQKLKSNPEALEKYLNSVSFKGKNPNVTTVKQLMAIAQENYLPSSGKKFSQFYGTSVQSAGDSAEWYLYLQAYLQGINSKKEYVFDLLAYQGRKMNLFGYDEVISAANRKTDLVCFMDGIETHIEIKVGRWGSNLRHKIRAELYADYLRLQSNPGTKQAYKIYKNAKNGLSMLDDPEQAFYLLRMMELMPDRVSIYFEDVLLSVDDLLRYVNP